MAKRKTRDCWRFFLNYGQGWEHEITEYTREKMKENRKAYRENSTYPLKIVRGRELKGDETIKLTETRRYYMRLPQSINNHSCRVFSGSNGRTYLLDRCTDASPRYFTVYDVTEPKEGINPRVLIRGHELWGDGLGWTAAIEQLAEHLTLETL